jgi:hypothetical protein
VSGNPVTASSFAVSTTEDSSISGNLKSHVSDINAGASLTFTPETVTLADGAVVTLREGPVDGARPRING